MNTICSDELRVSEFCLERHLKPGVRTRGSKLSLFFSSSFFLVVASDPDLPLRLGFSFPPPEKLCSTSESACTSFSLRGLLVGSECAQSGKPNQYKAACHLNQLIFGSGARDGTAELL